MIKVMYATKSPLEVIGNVASTCWNSKPSKQIAIDCIKANHGRVMEYADITISIEGYSARMIRELYTAMVGVSKLQSSTRYVEYGEFQYYVPDSLIDSDKDKSYARNLYYACMANISTCYKKLQELGIPKEDIANILPLGMMTTVVLKINLRAILHLFELRTCARAYREYRSFMSELKEVVSNIDEDWKYILDNFAKTKCEILGYCNEKNSCGRYSTK